MSNFDTVYHGNATVVRKDPFDVERLYGQRKTALKFLQTVQFIVQDGGFKEIKFEWRGIGCIRFKFESDRWCKQHLHVWHKDLMLTGIDDEGGNIHEHPYQLVSDVLCGELRHTHYICEMVSGDGWHYHEYSKPSVVYDVYNFDKALTPIDEVHAVHSAVTLKAPCSYTFARDHFHSSEVVSEVAVTRCLKMNWREGSSRALVRHGKTPVISTPFEPLSEATFKRVIDCAVAALEKDV